MPHLLTSRCGASSVPAADIGCSFYRLSRQNMPKDPQHLRQAQSSIERPTSGLLRPIIVMSLSVSCRPPPSQHVGHRGNNIAHHLMEARSITCLQATTSGVCFAGLGLIDALISWVDISPMLLLRQSHSPSCQNADDTAGPSEQRNTVSRHATGGVSTSRKHVTG